MSTERRSPAELPELAPGEELLQGGLHRAAQRRRGAGAGVEQAKVRGHAAGYTAGLRAGAETMRERQLAQEQDRRAMMADGAPACSRRWPSLRCRRPRAGTTRRCRCWPTPRTCSRRAPWNWPRPSSATNCPTASLRALGRSTAASAGSTPPRAHRAHEPGRPDACSPPRPAATPGVQLQPRSHAGRGRRGHRVRRRLPGRADRHRAGAGQGRAAGGAASDRRWPGARAPTRLRRRAGRSRAAAGRRSSPRSSASASK